jgi:hypothetical protein
MPLFEEKLICPLAVRFTQEHIRPVFQDGRTLEETMKEIKHKPGSDEYDVILDVPFDPIEIIRWRKRDESRIEPSSKHWFTFDNRRLYCLQRTAISLWPRRVGAVVQALYAATDGSHRKDTSLTAGRCVWIGHSLKVLTDGWDWRDVVGQPPLAESNEDDRISKAHSLIVRDDCRAGYPDLCDAPAPPSMLDLFFQGGGDSIDVKPVQPQARSASKDSTADPSTPRCAAHCDDSPGIPNRSRRQRQLQKQQQEQWQAAYSALSSGLCGEWHGDKREIYQVETNTQGWKVSRTDMAGYAKKFTLWYDEESDTVWWGSSWAMYIQASEVREQSGKIRWYGSNGSWKPRFVWAKQCDTSIAEALLEVEGEGDEEAQGSAVAATGGAQQAQQGSRRSNRTQQREAWKGRRR